jgi:hypothetical protein
VRLQPLGHLSVIHTRGYLLKLPVGILRQERSRFYGSLESGVTMGLFYTQRTGPFLFTSIRAASLRSSEELFSYAEIKVN